MRIFLTIIAIAFLAASARVEPAAAQCSPDVCSNPSDVQSGTKTHHRHKHIAKNKRPAKPKEKVQYMRY